ncbi:MAG TPA: FAD-dependent oxidoreductase [Jiangellaceae bacterium]|nr:FAD-dependent oxidoreductase [Jiangellaceae bacterium]
MPTSRYDVVVVGAGPAGLAAAAAAVRAGCSVAMLDAARQPGGQYWRHPLGDLDAVADLHHDLKTFRELAAVARTGADHLADHQVWNAARGPGVLELHAICDGRPVVVVGSAVVLAPGAYDRQLPFPGWDLPGVLTAGGAQALLKGHQVRAGRRIAVGGTGPFLLSVSAGLATRGVDVAGVFEANSPTGWVRHLPTVARTAGKLAEGAGYAAALARHRVGFHVRQAIVAAHGEDSVRAVTVARLDPGWHVVSGTARTIACDAVAVGWGFVPQLELPLSLGCATRTDIDGSLVAVVDERQASSVPGVFLAGEVCGVGGAALAVTEGEIAGRAAAAWLGRRVDWPDRLRRRRRAHRAFATALHRAHPVRDGWRTWLDPATVVCRCEEVPVVRITDAVHHLGATDARSVKLLSRAGMGWCQGRMCAYATGCLTSLETGRPADPGDMAERSVAVPIPLGVLADETDR